MKTEMQMFEIDKKDNCVLMTLNEHGIKIQIRLIFFIHTEAGGCKLLHMAAAS